MRDITVQLVSLPNKTLRTVFNSFSREKLRKLAKINGIQRGRDKEDTIRNLLSPMGLEKMHGHYVMLTIHS